MAKPKIYTKSGDQGQTSLVTGQRVSKAHSRIAAYGACDELNSFIGLSISYLQSSATHSVSESSLRELKLELQRIQNMIFSLGSQLSCDKKEFANKLPTVTEHDIDFLEACIDRMEKELPALKNFILPGGSSASATLHVARTVCRRAERLCVELRAKLAKEIDNQKNEALPETFLTFLNRLSDYLFVAARFNTFIQKDEEIIWHPPS